ncbi:MAG: 50S ribosomal protein L3 [Oscillospiraceae bacterium]|jgi:large subunit ribosomal protein L3|nr:50S ribosomal protein L3 [Oscillospiraceae bacterium]
MAQKVNAKPAGSAKRIATKAIVGKKIGMTQMFSPEGVLVPVTVIEAGPCPIIQKKTVESDGYAALQVGFSAYPERRVRKLVTKPLQGHFKKAGVAPTRRVRELRLKSVDGLEVGQSVTVDIFKAGDKVDVSGVTKGRGFTGVIQRWNQHTGPMAHGSKYHRGVGSMGANSTPSRVFKNKHLPGHYGVEKVTAINLTIARVVPERNLLLVRGAVPGPNGGYLTVRDTVRARSRGK